MAVTVQNLLTSDLIRSYLNDANLDATVWVDRTLPTPSIGTGTLLAATLVKLCTRLDKLGDEKLSSFDVNRTKEAAIGELLYTMHVRDSVVTSHDAARRLDSDMSYAISCVVHTHNKSELGASTWSAGLMEVADRERWGE